MKRDPGLVMATRVLEQIEASLQQWRTVFAEAARTAGSEVYREKLQNEAILWAECATQWGRGSGFKLRVKERLQRWFEDQSDLATRLEKVVASRFNETVVRRLEALCDETGAESELEVPAEVARFRVRAAGNG
jgi:hypothetical protein